MHRLRPHHRRHRGRGRHRHYARSDVVNLGLSLLYAAERTPEADAVVDGDSCLDYRDLQRVAAKVAGGLASLGVGRGDRMALVLKNRREAVELYWACQWLGAVVVPLSWRVAAADVAYCVADSGATVVAFEDVGLEHARACTDAVDRFVAVGTAGAGSSADLAARFCAGGEAQPCEPYESLLAAGEAPGAPEDLDDRETSIFLYTSGTTGRPKGVPRSHAAERAGGLSQSLHQSYRPGERTLGVMPLYHTMGIHTVLAAQIVGGCFVCQPDWDAAAALELIESERIGSLYLAPTLFHDLVHLPDLAGADVSSVHSLAYAGAAMTSALVERCVAVFAPEVFINHYGSTEIYTYSVDFDQRAAPGCAGRPATNARLRLVRPEPGTGPDDEVAPGETGEIICHLGSDEAFAGYWNRPDADARAIRGDWYFTGDLGRLDDDGNLWIVGRIDDMIISGGENVHPLEVEDVLERAPGVREVAVVGLPDDRWGQAVTAFVVLDDELAEAGEHAAVARLDAYCLESADLARFKRPRRYRFPEALPKSPSGKILRRVLREQNAGLRR
ncbi:MAG: AMP-binding protein [Acidimicrobiia bacterium]|nr:AMP-binding protein [Acidimicrobiia bacterium]MYC44571.1 AMP-binding protein [Acidimicrobiia bacterium]